MFICTVCGYIHEEQEAPETCPKCGAPKEKFERMPEEGASLVQRSRLTNELHTNLLVLLAEVEHIAADGVEDDLDPACKKIFERAMKDADELMRSIRAEVAGHVKKGKWG